MDLGGVGGRDEYGQNTLHKILKELMKSFNLKKIQIFQLFIQAIVFVSFTGGF